MKIDELAKTCEIENAGTIPVDNNEIMLNKIADKVETLISEKLAEFDKTVNTDNSQFNNGEETTAVINDNAGNDAGTNNDTANSSGEME